MILTGLENYFFNAALFFWIVYLFIILFRDRVRELLNIDKLRFLLNRTSMTELDKSYLHLSRKLSNSSNMMHSLKSLVCCIRGLLHSFYTFPDPRPVGASDQEGGRKMCRWQGNGFFFFSLPDPAVLLAALPIFFSLISSANLAQANLFSSCTFLFWVYVSIFSIPVTYAPKY